MNNLTKTLSRLIASSVIVLGCSVGYAAIAVIAHPTVSDVGISMDELEKIYLGKSRSLPSGTSVTPIDQGDGSSISNVFYEKVTGKDGRAIKSYWSKRMFSGKGKPPKRVDGDAAVINTVAETRGAIGYIDGGSLTDRVKVLLIIP